MLASAPHLWTSVCRQLTASGGTIFLLVGLWAGASFGQADPWAGVEEFMVRGQSGGALGLLSETGSVTGFDEGELLALGIDNTADLADFTPNLEIVQNSATTATFFIRGVGLQDFSANAAGAIAIYLDGIPLGAPPLQVAPIFDAADVEVLKGPQGTGNYRNASGGLIAVRSKRPDLDAASANFRTSQGQYLSVDAIDAHTASYDVGLSVPVVPGVLATRFAFRASQSNPIYTNRCAFALDAPGVSVCGEPATAISPLLPANLNREVGKEDVYSMRSSWLFKPEADFEPEFFATVYFSRRDQDGNFGQAIGTGDGNTLLGGSTTSVFNTYTEPDGLRELTQLQNTFGSSLAGFSEFADNFARTRPLDKRPYDGDFNINGVQRVEILGGSLSTSFTFGDVELSTNTGFARFDTTAGNDTDFTPLSLFEIFQETRGNQATQDLVLKGEIEDFALEWEAGGFFLWEDLEFTVDSKISVPIFNARRFADQDTLSWGIYGRASIEVLDDVTLSGGVRFNQEWKRFGLKNVQVNFNNAPFASDEEERTWREPTGDVQLLWNATEFASVYFKFVHGFKPGTFNSNGLDADKLREFAGQETLDSFEVGGNISLWADRFKFSGALFHYDYTEYQVFLFEDVPNSNPALQVTNANDARVLGAEFEMMLNPLQGYVPESIEGLTLTLTGSWLDSKFLDFQNAVVALDNNLPIQFITDYTGNNLIQAPRFSLSGGVRWQIMLGRLGTIEPRYDFSWSDDVYFDPAEGRGPARPDFSILPEFTLGQRSYVFHNVRLTYTPGEGQISVSGWCQNVTDERFKTFAFDVSRFRGVVVNFVGPPRTCGADLSLTW